jgi:hypothetical protein
VMCQVGIGKASVSEPLMTCRKAEDDIKTGTVKWCRDELGGARVLARRCPAWRRRESDLRLLCGTWESAWRHRHSEHSAGMLANVECERERVERQKP